MTRLLQRILWHWLGAYTIDQTMLDGMLNAIHEEAALEHTQAPRP